MAMILDAFLGNFKEMLTKMAEEEVGMLCGVPGEIEKLGRTVGDIQCLLSDAERRQTESKSIEKWIMELTDVMYDADDIMDLCQIKAEERSERRVNFSSSKFGCGISMLSCLRNPLFAHKIGTQIKELNSRLNEIYERKSKLGLQIESQNDVGPSNVRLVASIPSAPLADIVGDKIEEDTAMLVKSVTSDEESVKENVSAVAIVGMAGIGKSTLAKKVFNDLEIQREFPLRIWVCVSKDLKEVKLLQSIIRQAEGDYGADEERSELVGKLGSLIQNIKFFLVLDDVWPESEEVWNGLLREAMIGGARGSRLLVTTRDDRVARFFQATTTHHVQKLSDKDAWSILTKQVSISESDSETLKDIGLELVKKCDGLPLAIIAIGGVLRERGKDILKWRKISESPLWSLVRSNHYFPQAFYLSYEDLPSHLKQCFIFCSLYPEDFVFDKIQLVYLWLAEGFLCDKGDLSFYEMGLEYYNQLISRNLLEVDERYLDQGCKMHDLWRSFAGDKRKGDSLIMKERGSVRSCEPFLKLRRLSIESSTVDLNVDFLNQENSLRTLLLMNNSMSEVLSNALLLFSHLRILDLSNCNISCLSDSFGGLVQLRYLNISRTNLETLPNSIGNLRKLEFLQLAGCGKLSYFPSSIVNLVELRYFCFCGTKVEVFPMGLRKLKKLNVLCGFQPGNNGSSSSRLEDLGTLSLLSTLLLLSMDKIIDISGAKEANLEKKDQLKELCFCYKPNMGCQVSKPIEEKKAAQDVLNALSIPPSLEVLKIFNYFGDQHPIWLHVGTKLKFLRYLYIENCECVSQLPPLGQLPNLNHLTIKGANSVVRIGREFLLDDTQDQIETNMSHSLIPPFSQLNKLVLVDMPSWVEWTWDERQPAMPKLKYLRIEDCPKLSSLPKGLLHHASSLEVLEINAVEQLKSVEDLGSLKELYVRRNSNLESIANLANLSFIKIENCPNLKILENLKPGYRMELVDYEMEILPEYLRKIEPEKLTVRCRENLIIRIVMFKGPAIPEWQKYSHISVVQFYGNHESLWATYQKTTNWFNRSEKLSSMYRRTQAAMNKNENYRALMASLIHVTPIVVDRSAT